MKYFLILFLLCPLVTLADSRKDIEQTTTVEVVGSTYSGGRAYGFSGGDMDINDCLATHSVLFGLWQGTHVNKLCEADRLNRDGRYQAAAEMKCSVRSIRKVYGRGSCVEAVMLVAPPPPPPPPVVVVEEDDDEEEEWHDEQMQMQQDYDERIERIEARLNRPAPVVVDHDAERRAKSRASLAEFQKGVPEK
jgi:hypothetical protein